MSLSIRSLCGSLTAVLLLLMANTATAQSQPTNFRTVLAQTSPDPGSPFTFAWFWTDHSAGQDSVQLQYKINSQGDFKTLTTFNPGTPSPVVLETQAFPAGTTFQFQLVDVQGSNVSLASNLTNTTVQQPTMFTPTNLQASPVNDGTVSVTYTDTSNAALGVEIWAQPVGGAAFHAVDVPFYQPQPISVSGLAPGTQYIISARTYEQTSTGARVYSAFASTTNNPTTAPLAAPTNLQAFVPQPNAFTPGVTGTTIGLSWSNNSVGATAYQLLQRISGGGAFTVSQTIAAGSTSASLVNLPPGATMDFAVQAIYVPPTGSPVTAMSNIFTIRTQDAITSPHSATAVVGQPFSYTITSSNDASKLSTNVTGLPNGLTWDGNVTISGIPTAAGVTQADLTVNFSGGWSDLPFLAIRVLNGPSATTPIGSQSTSVGTAPLSIPLATHFTDPDESSAVQVSTTLGNMNFVLSDSAAPQSVANFRAYINNGTYTGNVFHRSIGNFIIQGGSFKAGSTSTSFSEPPTLTPVTNEYTGVSNTVGTVAFALQAGLPNSGTDGWFVNLENNGLTNLDAQDFTVFARVAGNGMQVAKAIAALPTGTYNVGLTTPVSGCTTSKGSPNITVSSATSIGSGATVTGTGIPAGTTVTSVTGNTVVLSAAATASGTGVTLTFSVAAPAFQNWPLNAANSPPVMNNTQDVNINSVTPVSIFNYTVSTDNAAAATPSISNGNLVITPLAQGSANITVTATDLDGNSVNSTFALTVAPSSDATLKSLTLSSGSLSFSPGTTTYAVTVPVGTTSITVTPTVNEADATLTINSIPATSGQPSSAFDLSPNTTTPITIVVTAQDTTTQDTYTLNVTRPLVTTTLPTTVLSGYATLNGSVNPNGQPTTADFQYGTSTGYGSTTPVTNLGSGTSIVPVSFNVAGLAKGTTYHYRLVITSGGTTYFGADQTFVTPSTASPANWHSAQISGLTNPSLNNMADGARTGVAQPGANLYFYKGTDNNIWAVFLAGNTWAQQQLTTLANVADWLAYDPNFSTLNYQGTDGNMWCVYYDSKAAKWTSQQLGTLPQGVTIAGDIVVDNFGGWNNIYYRGSDSHLYAVYFNGSAWVHTAIGGTATVKGSLAIQGNNHLVYYQSTDNNLWCFYYNGKVWTQIQLTTTGNVAGTVAVDNVGFTVYYKSNVDNSAWCGYSAGGPWTALQLDTTANLSASATSFSNIAPYPLNDCTVYLDNNGQCGSLYFNGSQWTHAVLGDGGSSITGGLSLQVMNHWIFARRSDGSVVIFYLG